MPIGEYKHNVDSDWQQFLKLYQIRDEYKLNEEYFNQRKAYRRHGSYE
jgi:hypothetical protein